MATSARAPRSSDLSATPKYQLDDIESLFETLISHPGVKNIAAIGVENKKLRKQYEDLERDNKATLNQVGRLTTSLEKAEKEREDVSKKLQIALKDKQALGSQHLEAKQKLTDNEKNLAEERTKMQQQVDSVMSELNEERDKLQKMSAFSAKLAPIMENYKHLRSILDSMRTSAVKLAEEYLCDDVPLNGINWGTIKSHTALSGTDRIFPLPVSNSPVAKRMRAAAFLAILGHELRNHIFQPLYFPNNSTELNDFLNSLAKKDEEIEAHLRSVLLRAIIVFRDVTDSVSFQCIQSVVGTVTSCVESLVLEAKRQPFVSELKMYCAKACKEWEFIQKLERRVEFETDPDDNDLKDKQCWLPLSSKPSNFPVASPSKPHASGGNKNNKGTTTLTGTTSSPPQSPVEAASFLHAVVVWPAVTAERENDMAILSLGHFLTTSEIATAMVEQKELPASKDQHRAARDNKRKSRSMSTAGHSFGENGGAAGRSGSFLFAQVGNGSRGS
ncbi:hypothetical protein QBC36DRAFT_233514 [Triangularia setosa]|uniref:MEI5 protein n=1 Tax=Triangularia setosa TaxID=2587417 RepID=A0AAN7A9Z7_9PEZI|nr:hypothetical protein QBC36DRAFT_233514 [Podospora setosa]